MVDSSALEFILSRSRSRDLMAKVSVSRPEVQGILVSWFQDSMLGDYACSTITVICSTFKRVLCHQLELMHKLDSVSHRNIAKVRWVKSRYIQ